MTQGVHFQNANFKIPQQLKRGRRYANERRESPDGVEMFIKEPLFVHTCFILHQTSLHTFQLKTSRCVHATTCWRKKISFFMWTVNTEWAWCWKNTAVDALCQFKMIYTHKWSYLLYTHDFVVVSTDVHTRAVMLHHITYTVASEEKGLWLEIT